MRACNFPILFIFLSVGESEDLRLSEFDNMHYRKVDNVNYSHVPALLQEAVERQTEQEKGFKWGG